MSLTVDQKNNQGMVDKHKRQIKLLEGFISDSKFEKGIEIDAQRKFIEQLITIRVKIKEHEESIETLERLEQILSNKKMVRDTTIKKLMTQNVLEELIKSRDYVAKQIVKTHKIIKEWNELIDRYRVQIAELQNNKPSL
jgi:hypothetical protein